MHSLNLLPDNRKHVLAVRAQVDHWRGAMVIAALGIAVAVVGLVGINWSLENNVARTEASLTEWQALSARRESGKIKGATEKINATIQGLNGLFHPFSSAAKNVPALLDEFPEGVTISSLSVGLDGQVTVVGVASSRATFLALRTALEKSTVVKNMTTASTASQRENLPFEYTGQLISQP